MSNAELKQITAAIDIFDHAMLVTQHNKELRSRPMAIGDWTDDGRIRFITSDDSGKVEEIVERHEVNVVLQGESKFLSISGNARITKDRDLIDKSWTRSQNPWFSEGRDDPRVVVLEVIPGYVEYWDRTGPRLLRSALNLARQALGQTVDRESAGDKHQEVDFSGKPL